MKYLDGISKMIDDLCTFPTKTIQITIIKALTSNAGEAEIEWFYEDLQDLLDLTPKRCPYRGLECKSRKSRDTWRNREIWPLSIKLSRAGLPEFCQESTWVIANTLFQQHKRREDSIREHHQMVNTKIRFIIFFAGKDGEALNSQKKQDRELTVAQIMSSLLSNSDLN